MISTTQVRHGINPANKQQNPPVPVANEADLDRAVTGARAAFMKWSKTPLEERRKAVAAYGDAIEANKDAFARLLTGEQGKPISQANVEVDGDRSESDDQLRQDHEACHLRAWW